MKSTFALAVLFAGYAAAQSGTASAPTATPSISACILKCSTTAASDAGCTSFSDLSCVCTSTAFQQSALQCIQSTCPDEAASAVALQSSLCGSSSASGSASSASETGSASSASVSRTATAPAGSSAASGSASSSRPATTASGTRSVVASASSAIASVASSIAASATGSGNAAAGLPVFNVAAGGLWAAVALGGVAIAQLAL